jgi:hypothetical protein
MYAVDGVVLINQASVNAAGGFPYVISQPGSYKLAGNLVAKDTTTNLIVVKADNVTIDLNGFAITGTNTCLSGCSLLTGQVGISIDFYQKDLTIVNGTVAGMGGSGISLNGDGIRIDSVISHDNGSTGIFVRSGQISHVRVFNNGGYGIQGFAGGGILQNSYSARNALSGFDAIVTWSYFQNNFQLNGLNVTGGPTNMGQNLCGTSACPGAVF